MQIFSSAASVESVVSAILTTNLCLNDDYYDFNDCMILVEMQTPLARDCTASLLYVALSRHIFSCQNHGLRELRGFH